MSTQPLMQVWRSQRQIPTSLMLMWEAATASLLQVIFARSVVVFGEAATIQG